MKCNQCGTEFDGNFCPCCGAASEQKATIEQPKSIFQNDTIDTNVKPKRAFLKKWWFWAIVVIVVIAIFSKLGNINKNEDAAEFEWANMELSEMLPKPESNYGDLSINSEDYLSIDVLKTTEGQYRSYVNACREKGFTVDVEEYSTTFTAKNEAGYELMLYYFESDEEMSIDLTAPTKTSDANTSKNESENNSTQDDKNATPQETPTNYAEDVVVNRFITEFNNKTKYEMTNISQGNIKTKYFAYANDCYIEMINANEALADCFSIKINGGQKVADRDRMFEVFAESIKVLDPTITDDMINKTVNYLKSEQYMVSDYAISDTVTIETYVPIVELSSGKTSCRIDVISSDYQ